MNLKVAQFYVCAFLSQQAAEKSLKAVHIERLHRLAPRTHNLLELGRQVKVPSKLFASLRALNPEFVVTRYPDAANGVPAEIYDRRLAVAKLRHAEKVVRWVRSKIQK